MTIHAPLQAITNLLLLVVIEYPILFIKIILMAACRSTLLMVLNELHQYIHFDAVLFIYFHLVYWCLVLQTRWRILWNIFKRVYSSYAFLSILPIINITYLLFLLEFWKRIYPLFTFLIKPFSWIIRCGF